MKTKVAFLIIIFFVVISNTFAQKIKDEAVPQDVFISFKYKYPDAEVLEWSKSDTNYVADYSLKNQEGYAEFTPKGKWLKTKFYVKEKELPSPILAYFRDNYKSQEFQIDESALVKTNENQTYYHILLKKPGIGQPEPVELFFDFSGKFQKKIDPNESKVNKDVNTDNQNTDVKNKDGKNKKEKTVKKNTVPTPEDKEKVLAEFAIADTKVPEGCKAHFKSKNKKASGVAWYFKDKKYTVRFITAGKKGQTTYTAETNAWEETRITGSIENINPQIQKCMDEKFKGYIIKYLENVQKPKDKMVYILAYHKKDRNNPDPPLTEIFFDSNGKYRNVNRPDILDPKDIEEQKRKDEEEKDFQNQVEGSNLKYEGGSNTNQDVKKKELPTAVLKYIKSNFPEHKIKETKFTYNEELLSDVYYVKLKKEGLKEITELYFDVQGKLLKKVDEAEKKAKKEIEIEEFNE
jgi:hypothetical protein